jgi:hypothetical protein
MIMYLAIKVFAVEEDVVAEVAAVAAWNMV